MATIVFHATVAQAMMDALDADVGSTGCVVLYDGAVGSDNAAIPSGTELVVINLGNPAFGSAAVTGSAGSRVCRITMQTETPASPSASGNATSFAIFKSQSTRTVANMTLKGDVTTTAVGTGALQLDAVNLVSGGGNVDFDESNSYLEMALNQ